jgi:predicted HTH transcriptional regulator
LIKNKAIHGSPIGGSIKLTDRQLEVLNMIKEDNKISKRNIAIKLDINRSAVEKHLKALQNNGVLKRIGGTRGYWEVNYDIR